jgi:hypothetical protein
LSSSKAGSKNAPSTRWKKLTASMIPNGTTKNTPSIAAG